MQTFEQACHEVEAEAVGDGFMINPDGSVSTDDDTDPTDEQAQILRARHEHRLMQIHGQETDLQARTVATIRERIDADIPGMPWAILECARGGHDVTAVFNSCLALPDSPFTTLMHEHVAHAAEANAAVWLNPGENG